METSTSKKYRAAGGAGALQEKHKVDRLTILVRRFLRGRPWQTPRCCGWKGRPATRTCPCCCTSTRPPQSPCSRRRMWKSAFWSCALATCAASGYVALALTRTYLDPV